MQAPQQAPLSQRRGNDTYRYLKKNQNSPVTSSPAPSANPPSSDPTTSNPTLSPIVLKGQPNPMNCDQKDWAKIPICVLWFEANATPTPTSTPSVAPISPTTYAPTDAPANAPTDLPSNTKNPTLDPTLVPTNDPTDSPTTLPTTSPTLNPTLAPARPSPFPTLSPTLFPTIKPSLAPTLKQNKPIPQTFPTLSPTLFPTLEPSLAPTVHDTDPPTSEPTLELSNMVVPEPTIERTPDPSLETKEEMSEVSSSQDSPLVQVDRQVRVPLPNFDMELHVGSTSNSWNSLLKVPVIGDHRELEFFAAHEHLLEVHKSTFRAPLIKLELRFSVRGETQLSDSTIRYSSFGGTAVFGRIDGESTPTKFDVETSTLNAFVGNQKVSFLEKFHGLASKSSGEEFDVSNYDVVVRKDAPALVTTKPYNPSKSETNASMAQTQNKNEEENYEVLSSLMIGTIAGGCVLLAASLGLIFYVQQWRTEKKRWNDDHISPPENRMSKSIGVNGENSSPALLLAKSDKSLNPLSFVLKKDKSYQYSEFESDDNEEIALQEMNSDSSLDESSLTALSLESGNSPNGNASRRQGTEGSYSQFDFVEEPLIVPSGEKRGRSVSEGESGSVWSVLAAEGELDGEIQSCSIGSVGQHSSLTGKSYDTSLAGASTLFTEVMQFETTQEPTIPDHFYSDESAHDGSTITSLTNAILGHLDDESTMDGNA